MTGDTGHRPRILYLATSMGVGGAEQQARYLARTFRRRGWDVLVVSLIPLSTRERELEAEGIEVRSLGIRPGTPDPRGLVRLVGLLREWRPDVLHSHMVHANLLARLARPLARTPVVVSSVHTPNEGRQWRYLAYRLTNPLTDCTTAVSQDAIDAATRRGAAPRDGIRLIPNGLDMEAFKPDEAVRIRVRRELGLGDEFSWLAVGRLTTAKAYPDMIAAFEQVHRSHPPARLLVAGPGPLQTIVESRVRSAGLGDRVSLLGHRDDVPDLMRAADGFLLSSAWEGLPMVLLEAAASGLPIVATRVGGNAVAVADGVTGRLVEAGDPAALAGAMLDVMAMSPGERRAMGLAGRDLVKRGFDLEATADTWEALYQELLGRVATGRRRGAAGQPHRP